MIPPALLRHGAHHRRLACALSLAAVACNTGNGAAATDSASVASTAAQDAAEEASRPALALPVMAEEARDGDLVLRVTTTGQIRSDAAVKLRAEVAGTVAQLVVRPGQAVSKGQVLARLDGYPFDLSVRDAQASADEAEQRFLESFVPESVVTGRGPTPEQRKALMNKAGLVGARLRLERARYEQDRATIRSPVNGTVDAIDISAGERPASKRRRFSVSDSRS